MTAVNRTSTAIRLSTALLGYFILIVLLLTLNPFYLRMPAGFRFSLSTTPGDVIANVILFLPIGYLYRLTGGGVRGALFMGASFSLMIEAIQIFIPARTPSLLDWFCNTVGALLGAVLHDFVSKRLTITPGMVGSLRLETPLMGLTYLLMPLLWLNTLSAGDLPGRWVLAIPLGATGAIIFSELFRQWLEPGFRTAGIAALTTGVWFLIGSAPGLLRQSPILPLTLTAALLSAALTVVPRQHIDRRFERSTLRRILPLFVLYLVLAALWDPFRPLSAWHGMFGFTTRLADTSLQGIYPRGEYLTAFAVLGYIAAEWRGRDERSLRRDLPRLILVAAGSALSLEVAAGFQSGSGASLIRGGLAVLSAIFGGAIYHLLRAHIRFLTKRAGTI